MIVGDGCSTGSSPGGGAAAMNQPVIRVASRAGNSMSCTMNEYDARKGESRGGSGFMAASAPTHAMIQIVSTPRNAVPMTVPMATRWLLDTRC